MSTCQDFCSGDSHCECACNCYSVVFHEYPATQSALENYGYATGMLDGLFGWQCGSATIFNNNVGTTVPTDHGCAVLLGPGGVPCDATHNFCQPDCTGELGHTFCFECRAARQLIGAADARYYSLDCDGLQSLIQNTCDPAFVGPLDPIRLAAQCVNGVWHGTCPPDPNVICTTQTPVLHGCLVDSDCPSNMPKCFAGNCSPDIQTVPPATPYEFPIIPILAIVGLVGLAIVIDSEKAFGGGDHAN